MSREITYLIPPYYKMKIMGKDVKIFSYSKKSNGKELSQWLNYYGYIVTKLSNKTVTIHSLVSKYAIGERPEGFVINHIDGDKLNNSPSNLEYCTIAENIKHSIEMGLHVSNDPKRSGRYKDGRTIGRLNAYKLDWYHKNKFKNKGK